MRLVDMLGAALVAAAVGACSSSDPEAAPPGEETTPPADDDGGGGTTAAKCGRLTIPCDVGGACEGPTDCKSGACRDGACADVPPPDNSQNDGETDVDCGGPKAPACDDGKKCLVATDCKSAVCTGGICQVPTATDGVKNADEVDVDCGGASSPKCGAGKKCVAPAGCDSGVCTGGVCQAPTATDGVQNGEETGIDCGGPTAPKCKAGGGCVSNADCDKLKCDTAGTKKCLPASHDDGIQNSDETGIDCGGPTADKCPPGQGCAGDGDCDGIRCNATTKVCDPPSKTDGLKNGNESDVDCGSSGPGTDTGAPRCDAAKICAADADCKSSGCNHEKRCAWARSCTAEHGGTTCGTGDATAAGNENEDCCASEVVPTYDLEGYDNTLADFRLDKYQITAGRIRRFLTAVNGNVQKWVQDNRANVLDPSQLPASLDKYLPAGWTQADSADQCSSEGQSYPCNYGALNQVSGFRYNNEPGGNTGYGCYVSTGGYSTRTYWTSQAENDLTGQGEAVMKVSKDRADEKSMTCVTSFILAAFCAWDGGRLETFDEYNAAYGGNGSVGRTYPWGSDVASRPIGFNDLFSSVVAPTNNYGYTPPADPVNGQYSTYNANLTAQQKIDLLLRVDRANLRWNYYDGHILDYRAPLENRGTVEIAAENAVNVPNDQSVAVAPPGRYPEGEGRYGHRDLLGNVMEITATANGDRRKWTRNGSFETSHFNATNMVGYNYSPFLMLTKYGRTGGRCARPLTVYPATPLP